jgi:hypothetical protein
MATEEREDTDRNRERRAKKKQQRLAGKRKEQLDKAKEKLVPGFKLSKKRAMEKLTKEAADGTAVRGVFLPRSLGAAEHTHRLAGAEKYFLYQGGWRQGRALVAGLLQAAPGKGTRLGGSGGGRV